MKRVSILVVLTTVFLLAFSGVAFANFAIHGGYDLDTDACAGCHRAHTSFSEVRWASRYDPTITSSALLVSNAATMTQFCNTCHGDDAPGASTNVQSGIFDSGPSGSDGETTGTVGVGGEYLLYETNSTFGGVLNGGGFSILGTDTAPATSMHNMDEDGIMWGFGSSVDEAEYPNLICTSCHDPHGSVNYRLLKESINGNVVGYYNGDVPVPWVISAEEGYPVGGWWKHETGALQMAAYKPNYTAPEYAYQGPLNSTERSISGWCAACHEQYIVRESVYDYGDYEGYSAEFGAVNRHRHPVNTTLGAGVGEDRHLQQVVRLEFGTAGNPTYSLPLEARPASPNARGVWDEQDFLGCLTCHRAHGSDSVMDGWAVATIEKIRDDASFPNLEVWGPVVAAPSAPGTLGVEPTMDAALLRFDNRGVCERCHNK